MNDDMRTAEQFIQAVNAAKNALDTEGLEKDLDLEIAARFNVRRKLRMIKSMQWANYQIRSDLNVEFASACEGGVC